MSEKEEKELSFAVPSENSKAKTPDVCPSDQLSVLRRSIQREHNSASMSEVEGLECELALGELQITPRGPGCTSAEERKR